MKLSYSKLSSYKKCPKAYDFEYNKHLKTDLKKAFAYGTFIHKILEDIATEIKSGKLQDVKLSEAVKPIWLRNKNSSLADGLNESDIKAAKEAIQNYISFLYKNGLPQVVDVEQWMSINIGSHTLNGKIDLIVRDDKIHVIDHKTTKVSSIKYLEDDKTQLKLYVIGTARKYSEDPQNIKASFSLVNRNFDYLTYSFSNDELSQTESDVIETASKIMTDKTWEAKVGILCSYCSFFESCDAVQKEAKLVKKRREVLAAQE